MVVRVLIGVGVGLLAAWLALVVVLLVARPPGELLREAARLLPDLVRLLRRLAADRSLPSGVRWRLGLLLAYLAFPLDLVPDFVPLLGHADDAIVTVLVLRSVARRAGSGPIERHWPGTPSGLDAVLKLSGLSRSLPRAG
jgi:uncharacterized membrane protein YkvA (DUF1232 family)